MRLRACASSRPFFLRSYIYWVAHQSFRSKKFRRRKRLVRSSDPSVGCYQLSSGGAVVTLGPRHFTSVPHHFTLDDKHNSKACCYVCHLSISLADQVWFTRSYVHVQHFHLRSFTDIALLYFTLGRRHFTPAPHHFTLGPRHFTSAPHHFTLVPHHFTPAPHHFTLGPRHFT